MQIQRIREYFYGTPKFELAPYTTSVAFHEITVMRIGESKLASPASVVAAVADKDPDASTSAGDSHLLKIDSFTVLLNSVLAVSNAELEVDAGEEELEEILQTNIAGFVYVYEGGWGMLFIPCPILPTPCRSSVDEKRKRIHLLMPNPGRLPKRFLWMGSLRWTEHQ